MNIYTKKSLDFAESEYRSFDDARTALRAVFIYPSLPLNDDRWRIVAFLDESCRRLSAGMAQVESRRGG